MEGLEAFLPHLLPCLAHRPWVWRESRHRVHGRAPAEHLVGQKATAHVVGIVGVPVIGRVHGDDRLQCGRAPGGDLQAVESPPRLADHPDVAAAPRLGGNPGDGLDGVVLLLERVLVDEHAVGVSAAPDVEPHSRIPVTGEVAEATLIVNGEQVVLAVRDVLENRRDRDGRGNLGHPDPRTEAGTVG